MALYFRDNRYYVDFYVDGRGSRRIQKKLPYGLSTEEAETVHNVLVKRYKRKPGIAVDLGLTVCRAFESPRGHQ